MLKYSINMISI